VEPRPGFVDKRSCSKNIINPDIYPPGWFRCVSPRWRSASPQLGRLPFPCYRKWREARARHTWCVPRLSFARFACVRRAARPRHAPPAGRCVHTSPFVTSACGGLPDPAGAAPCRAEERRVEECEALERQPLERRPASPRAEVPAYTAPQ